ncbi:hypothetical protein C0099_12900 [Pseudazoarcus pumilus]|uniref:Type II secretion system protein GspC N-terminal domain-containing protein n=1 Tax=Pseudazoarcus pumilus TaxID=2067960 RepID=A0A2I6S924_9RHOO|nr:hypothetical protein C0099_12900 [Pseudazoarcus pumilus]
MAINLALLLGIAGLWLAGSTSWSPPSAVAPDEAMLAFPDARAPAAGYSVERIVARPLFAADRRPMAEDEPATEQSAETPEIVDNLDGMRLTGLVGEGASAIAIVEHEGVSRRIEVGQSIEGWRLDAIEPGVAVFSGPDGRSRRVEMSRPSLLSGAAGGAAAEPAARGSAPAARRGERLRERISRPAGENVERRGPSRSARNQDRSDR